MLLRMTAPMRVGILHDMAESAEEEASLGGAREAIMRLAIDDLRDRGRLDRDVEFVHGAGLGLPAGTAFAIERAFAELVAQGVILIVGPAIGDNALVATPLADQARIPTINWAGTERARSEYMFHLQVGSHEDESVLPSRIAVTPSLCAAVAVAPSASAPGDATLRPGSFARVIRISSATPSQK